MCFGTEPRSDECYGLSKSVGGSELCDARW